MKNGIRPLVLPRAAFGNFGARLRGFLFRMTVVPLFSSFVLLFILVLFLRRVDVI